jgi:hypothetical protein
MHTKTLRSTHPHMPQHATCLPHETTRALLMTKPMSRPCLDLSRPTFHSNTKKDSSEAAAKPELAPRTRLEHA